MAKSMPRSCGGEPKNGSNAKFSWCLDGSMCYACPGSTGGSVCQCECHSDEKDKDLSDTD